MSGAPTVDVIIVGSGPSGAMAASVLVRRGLCVHLVDFGLDDSHSRSVIPDEPFSVIRRTEPDQRAFFIGDRLQGVPTGSVRVGSQLTPPRQFVNALADSLLPVHSESFSPMQSLALGGLGAAWGGACHTYSREELSTIGIDAQGFSRYYNEVSAEIGISCDADADQARFCAENLVDHQPPLEIDSNAERLLHGYARVRAKLNKRGFFLGRPSLAILSRDMNDRKANPYFDMDFWSDSRKSVYRPRYTIEALKRYPTFRYSSGVIVQKVAEAPGGSVSVMGADAQGAAVSFSGRRVLLCAGAINSARLSLSSLGLHDVKTPILCNPYTYIACVNLGMLGRPARDRRHSLSQLCGVYLPPDAPSDLVVLQFYSYRSLLLFKLVKELPLPVWAALRVVRLLVNSLTIIGVHHSDAPGSDRWLTLGGGNSNAVPAVDIHYQPDEATVLRRQARERALMKILRAFGCVPCSTIHPGHASSIHYAGTIPVGGQRLGVDHECRLVGTKNVFVGDSSTWRALPAKGLTFTLMANARRVAEMVANDLEANSVRV